MPDTVSRDGTVSTGIGSLGCGAIPGLPWQCVYTLPSMELTAAAYIREAGFIEWVPLETVCWSNRLRRQRVAFPRYLLVQFDPLRDAWGKLNRTRGVDHVLISTAGKPLSIGWNTVDTLMRELAPGGAMHPVEPREMRRGDAGRVLAGPLAGFLGVCSMSTRERVTLLLSIMGRSAAAEFDRKQVEIA